MTNNSNIVERFKTNYLQIGKDTLNLLDSMYRHDIDFIDPLHQIKGLVALREYFANMYANVLECTFSYTNQIVQQEEAMIMWTMSFKHKKLNKGQVIHVQGATHIRFDDKVFYHRDYFDAGQMLYENVPCLGRVIRMLKKRVQ